MKRNQILTSLLDQLWNTYIKRVPYAQTYQQLVESQGGVVQNDHIAFRTFNLPFDHIPAGVESIARIFEPLGYTQKNQYIFTKKHLTAWHYEHENPDFPKIFISQLEINQLPEECAQLITSSVQSGMDPLTSTDIELLYALTEGEPLDNNTVHTLVESLADSLARKWPVPKRSVVETVNETSQYAAWTLLHGCSVNHFTGYINKQNVKAWPDIETTAAALIEAGVPMKSEIEGEPGSKLRQTATKAVMELCPVLEEDGTEGTIEWSYAYYEFAERNMITNENGKKILFQGFLGEQATHLFEMTNKDTGTQ